MKKIIFNLILLIFVSNHLAAQLPDGSPAPDFAITDINGNGYSLYAAMSGGKSACIDFFATWCGPCWSFHSSHVLRDVQTNLGYTTSVVMMEADFATNTPCFYGPSGCTGRGTQGNWVSGVNYPQADLGPGNGETVAYEYNVTYYPTLYVISPDFRTWEIGDRSYQNYYNWIINSFTLNATGSVTHSPCGDDGKVVLNVTGGFGSLKYKWSNGAVTKDLINIPGGTYSVTVTDLNGYFESYGPWTVNGPNKRVDIVSQSITHVKCFGESTGKIVIGVNYGTPGYTYNWSNGNNTNIISNVFAGNYSVTVTDASSCTVVKTYIITEPSLLTAKFLTYNETCDGQNGYIATSATGGVPPYSYDRGNGKQSNAVFSKLKQGTYTVTVTDKNNCSLSQTLYINGTHKPVVKPGVSTPLICGRDTIFFDASIGSSSGNEFIYTWTTRNGAIIGDFNSTAIKVAKPGTYNLKIENTVDHCENSDSVIVKDLRKYPDVLATGDGHVNCYEPDRILEGKTNALAIKYYWTKLNDTLNDTSKFIKVIHKGSYVFNVKDTINQCVSKDTVVVTENKVYPTVILNKSNDINCKYDEVTIDASQSDQGPDFNVEWTREDGSIIAGLKDLTFKLKEAAFRTLNIQNKINGCTTSKEVEIIEDRIHPIAEAGSSNDLGCITKTLNLDGTISSQGSQYNYFWKTINGNILNGSNTLKPLINQAGNYILNVRNTDNDCETKDSITVQEQTQPKAQFTFVKNNFELNFTDASQGIATSWNWSFGDGTNSLEQHPIHSYSKEGEYEVCLEITNECGINKSCQNVVLTNSAVLSLSSWEVRQVSCNGYQDGQIKLNVEGGTKPYSYLWSTGANTALISNLKKGNYSVTIQDALGSQINKGFSIDEPSAILLANQKINHTISGSATGSIEINIAGGYAPYRYEWNTGATTSTIQDLAAGTYHVKVLDANSCEKNFGPFEVNEVTSTKSAELFSQFEIKPNPVNQNGIISVHLNSKQDLKIKLYNANGRLIHADTKYGDVIHYSMSFENYEPGIYFVVIQSGGYQMTRKWVVQ